MKVREFHDLYLKELQEAHSVERQLVDALPRMKSAASDPDLKQAIENHLGETRKQLERLGSIVKRHDADPSEHEDQSMRSLIAEEEKWAGMLNDSLRDAALIASAQRIEHYEIAVYGTLACWAKQLGHDEDLDVLLTILDEEKQADERLTELAKREVNPSAR